MNQSLKGAIFTMAGGICWGLSGSMGQYLFQNQGMDSRWLVPIRLGLSGIILLIYCSLRYGKDVLAPFRTGKSAALTLVYGIPGVAICQLLYFLCIQLGSASLATILQSLSPIPILLVTCLIVHRLPRAGEILGIILALCGVFCLVTHGHPGSMSVSWAAVAAGLGSALCIMVYNMTGKKLLEYFPVELLQGWSFFFGGILFFLVFRAWTIPYVPSLIGCLGVIFIVIVGNIMAFTLYMSGVGLISPVKGIMYGFSEPVTAALVTVFLMGSSFTVWDALGFALIFTMLIVTSIKPKNQ